MSPKKVFVIGSYGSGNASDEAVLAPMLDGLRARLGDLAFTVPGERPAELERHFAVTSFPRSDIERLTAAVDAADLVILGGGGLLHDYVQQDSGSLLAPQHWGLTYYCGVAWLAAELGKPVMFYAVGVGPLLYPGSRDLVYSTARGAQAISVRDPESAQLLRELGVVTPEIECTADPVWRLRPAPPRGQCPAGTGRRSSNRLLGLAIRNWNLTAPQEV